MFDCNEIDLTNESKIKECCNYKALICLKKDFFLCKISNEFFIEIYYLLLLEVQKAFLNPSKTDKNHLQHTHV